jgi:hypothetical protein
MSDYLSLDDAGFDIFFQNLMTHSEETSVSSGGELRLKTSKNSP